MAEAYLKFLYTPEGQEIAAQAITTGRAIRRSRRNIAAQLPEARSSSPSTTLFGGWRKAQTTHFADGGVFDQIYAQ